MARKPQKFVEDGSQKWLQLTVNVFPNLLRTRITEQLHPAPSIIEWLSPLRSDEFAEYSDEDFIDLLGVEVKNCPLECFWPRGGPFWDALGKTDRSQILLVESKSYIGEMRGKGSGASNPKSVRKIASSLKNTQKFLGGSESADWFSSPYYQYANRLAHLYLFVELNGIDAYFLAIYFLNDRNMGGPHSSDHWEDAIQRQYADMRLPQDHRLRDRIIELFLDVRDLGGSDLNI